MEFKDYVRIVLSHWVGVVLLAIVGVAGAVGYNATQPEVYQASATGLVTIGRTSDSSQAVVGDQLAKNRVTSYVSLATTTDVADIVIDSGDLDGTDLPTSAGALVGHIGVVQPLDTVLITINARASRPDYAATLANAWVTALAKKVKQIDGPEPATDTGTTGTDSGTDPDTSSTTEPVPPPWASTWCP